MRLMVRLHSRRSDASDSPSVSQCDISHSIRTSHQTMAAVERFITEDLSDGAQQVVVVDRL